MPKACKHPDGCERPAVRTRGGWCRMHGARIARTGDPGPAGVIVNTQKRVGTMPGDPHFGDNQYRGRGVLTCAHCGRALRDHSILEPCVPIGAAV